MKTIGIKQKLEEMGVALEGIVMGDFDTIGEFTAKRTREPNDPNYKKHGATYRSNYERGILIYFLIRQHSLTSFLEVGFGRGYATLCAAKAFYDAGTLGKIVTIDPALDEKYVNALHQVLPQDWFKSITFAKGTSQAVLPSLNQQFDLVYIDGDHSYEGTKHDWELTRDRGSKFTIMDDYHLPTKNDPGIQCQKAIDQIVWLGNGYKEPELIIMDRRMFADERCLSDDQIDYGQVLFTREGMVVDRADW
jgi:hypothetical protein